jgi:hypothetical protein
LIDVDEAKFLRLCSSLVQDHKKTRGKKAGKKGDGRIFDTKRRPRLPRAAEHDAQMLLSVEALAHQDRGEQHPFGNRYWFVTLDRRLADTARRELDRSVGCVCMVAEEWVQYIAPFTGPDVSGEQPEEIFSTLLASRFFQSLGRSLTLRDLQPFTTPNVSGLLEGLHAEEAARAVAEAHAAQVTTGSPRQIDERRMERLAEVVDRKLEERRKAGELIPAAEVQGLVATHDHVAEAMRDEIAGRETQIHSLSNELDAVRAYQRSSVRFLTERFRERASVVLETLKAWGRVHPQRAAICLLFATAGCWFLFAGSGSLVSRLFGIALAVVAVCSISPRMLLRNFHDWIGWRRNDVR